MVVVAHCNGMVNTATVCLCTPVGQQGTFILDPTWGDSSHATWNPPWKFPCLAPGCWLALREVWGSIDPEFFVLVNLVA